MFLDAMLNGLCALLCFMTFWVICAHEVLMQPDRPNYPTGSWRLRTAIMLWGLALLWRSTEYAQSSWRGAAGPTLGQVAGCAMLLIVHAVQLEAHLRQWLPARTQERIRRLIEIAACCRVEAQRRARVTANAALHAGVAPGTTSPYRARPALAELRMQGVKVIAPGEGPAAIIKEEGGL